MESTFTALADQIQTRLKPGEAFTANLEGERSDFVRFNHAAIRQPGHVEQCFLTLRLIRDARHASTKLALTGRLEEDFRRLDALLERMRNLIPHLPHDPHLLVHQSDSTTRSVSENRLPSSEDIVGAVLDSASNTDMVGIFAGGGLYRGFASSWGQRSWYARHCFDLNWTLVHDTDKGVKQTLAGEVFDVEALHSAMARARERLVLLAHPSRTIEPGRYRAWLAPAATRELLQLACRRGFSAQGIQTHQSPLQRLYDGRSTFDARVSIAEDIGTGVAPDFQSHGFPRPERIALVEAGRAMGSLVSTRTAQEFDLQTNGADTAEYPVALNMAAGDLGDDDILATLGTGVWVSNLWYLNYSDRSEGRMTGMTRFATFWVEDGRIVAPLRVMRFDDSIFDLLGDRLEAIGTTAPLSLESGTYGGRSTGSVTVPGVLVDGLSFTL